MKSVAARLAVVLALMWIVYRIGYEAGLTVLALTIIIWAIYRRVS